MIERKFIYSKEAEGSEFHIYFIKDERTGKRRFYTLQEITENPQRIEELKEELIKPKLEYRTQTGAFVRENKDGKTQIFETNPCSMVEAGTTILKLEGEKVLDKIKNLDDVVIKSLKDIKDSKTAKAVVAILLATTIGISSVAVNFENWFAGNKIETPQTGPSIVETIPTNPTNQEGLEMILPEQMPPAIRPEEVKPEETKPSENPEYISPSYDNDIDTLEELKNMSYTTYTEGGVKYIDTNSAIEIAQAAYELFVDALNKYNATAPEGRKYNYEPSLYDMYDMLGRWMRETSHIVYVDYLNGETASDSTDYTNQCRGPVQIGPMAIEDSRGVVLNLFGEDIIKTEEDLYNFGLAALQSFCLNVRYNQIYRSLGLKDVTTNHLSAAYLYGAGGAYSGGKEDSSYALDIEWYAHCFREFSEKIKSGEMLRVDFIYGILTNKQLREEYFSAKSQDISQIDR